jgi:hypothetical protein
MRWFRRSRPPLEVRRWAEDNGYRLLSVQRTRSADPWPGAPWQGPLRGPRYYQVRVVDESHVEREGTVRVGDEWSAAMPDTPVSVRWLSAQQLDWRGQPPRGDVAPQDGTAEGWYRDPSGSHEQRWFSAGKPTDLIRDGAVEGHDPYPADAPPFSG